MKKTFETPGAVALLLRVPAGSVDVQSDETTETTVEIEARDDEVLERARVEARPRGEGHEVVVELDHPRSGFSLQLDRLSFGFWRDEDVRVTVRAPHGASIDLRSGSADVEARGRFGSVDIEDGSGDLAFDEIGGDLELKTGSGDVEIASVAGRVEVQTGSGDVEIGRIGGPAKIRAASGDVSVREAEEELTVQTASGDQEVGSVVEGSVMLQSASGDIEVGIKQGSRLWVDAKSMSGDTSSDLEVSDVPLDDDGPLVELRATSMSGDIHFTRA
jgi:putative adhesin